MLFFCFDIDQVHIIINLISLKFFYARSSEQSKKKTGPFA